MSKNYKKLKEDPTGGSAEVVVVDGSLTMGQRIKTEVASYTVGAVAGVAAIETGPGAIIAEEVGRRGTKHLMEKKYTEENVKKRTAEAKAKLNPPAMDV